jgi:signal transduction histidine kinase
MGHDAEKPRGPAVPLEAVNRLAVSIIHEVSNPLSIIIGNAQYILLGRDGVTAREAMDQDEITSTIQTILNESMRLAGLVSLLLGFSSKITIENPTPTSAVMELERLLNKLKSSWAPEIEFTADGTDPAAQAGQDRDG